MKLELKEIVVGTYLEQLDSFFPEDKFSFGELITVSVGILNDDGADNFNLFVCSPEWLKNRNFNDDVWGLYKLIIPKYDSEKIKKLINQKLDELSDNNLGSSGEKLILEFSRYAQWEFENYVP